MKARSMDSYLMYGDFEGAVERYETTSPSWKKRWWNVVEQIYNTFAEWGRKYIIDPVTRTVRKIGEKVKTCGNLLTGRTADRLIQFDCDIPDPHACGTYVVEHFNDGERVWLKVGKAKDLLDRMKNQLRDYAKKGEADTVVIRAFYPANSEEEALTMENHLRHHYKKDPDNGFLRQDRFVHGEWTPAVARLMNMKHIECRASFS